MLSFGNVLITYANGFYLLITKLFSPISIAIFILAISMFWMFLLEIDEYNRQGTKPDVGRH